MPSRVVISLDNVFLSLGPSTITSVFSEFNNRKLQVIQAFMSSMHVCSMQQLAYAPVNKSSIISRSQTGHKTVKMEGEDKTKTKLILSVIQFCFS